MRFKDMTLKQRARFYKIATDFPTPRQQRRNDLKMAVREERRRRMRAKR